jgi:phospholipid transport system substrate-binding protein
MRNGLMRWLRPTVVVVALLALVAPAAAQSSPTNASEWIADLANRVIVILKDQRSAPERRQQFRALIDERFDMPAIAQFVAGRYWRAASEDDRQQFTAAFTDYMVDFYTVRFTDYGNQTLRLLGQRVGEGATTVASQVVNPNGSPGVQLDWRVGQTPEGFKITDVAIGGVSLAITKRDEFAAVIQRNGGKIAALTAELDKRSAAGGRPTVN